MHVIVVFTKKRKSYASTYYGGSFLRIEPREYKNYNFEVSSHIFHQSHTPVVVSFFGRRVNNIIGNSNRSNFGNAWSEKRFKRKLLSAVNYLLKVNNINRRTIKINNMMASF